MLKYVLCCSLTLKENTLWRTFVCTWPVTHLAPLILFSLPWVQTVLPCKAWGSPTLPSKHCQYIKLKWILPTTAGTADQPGRTHPSIQIFTANQEFHH